MKKEMGGFDMFGITSFGAYIPAYRLGRDLIARAWGRGSLKGERSVANNDEDSLTMAVEAARDCLRGLDRDGIGCLYLATTTAPYREKMSAAVAATALDLGRAVFATDFANSLRSGTGAFRAAIDAVQAGSVNHVLVAASDCRLAPPRSDQEQWFGDGAAALTLGREKVVATVEASLSINNEITDVWRNDDDRFVRMGESRFVLSHGFTAVMEEVIGGILKRSGRKPSQISKLLISSPDERSHLQVAKKLGFNPETQIPDTLLSSVGHCGAAHPLMLLVSALETAKPGEVLLLTSYGDGADAFLLEVRDEVGGLPARRGIRNHLANRMTLSSYEKFLSFKGILETAPGEPFRLFPSGSAYWRDQRSILRCHGSRCRQCGKAIFPVQRVCFHCRAKDDFEEIRYSDEVGKVFSFTRDQLAGRSDDPVVVQTIFDMTDGARFYLMMTDCDAAEARVGLPVELTFRRIHEGADFHNYFWKCRPLRNGGS
ncbi:MAG: 3-hydroxy-3-methylglutaryl CoA synthase [Desulfobacteraceae bacterium]|nr:MAG: 3-hydroxy-3-methylglutaryl CoA synthase [Desulfobacteraceae bacterium]